MGDRPSMPRISPVGPDDRDEQATELLAGAGRPNTPAANIFATLVRNPGLFRKWMPFGGKLLNGKLPAREREIAVLRTGWLCRSEYEWGQHVIIGRTAGLTDAEIESIKAGPDAPGWSALDAALLRATDELHDDSCITDATWAALAAHYDEAQLIELTMLIGQYHLVSFTLNSLGVQREPGVPGFDG
jgi:4-carboxymuconolactone decarboxylase